MSQITSCVRTLGGVPQLFINEKPFEGAAYMCYLTERSTPADFAKAGYRLFSFPVFFASQHINPKAQTPIFAPGIFDGETPDFSKLDADVARILEAAPNAYLLPRVNITLPFRWGKEHPDELCDFGFHDLRWPSFSSDAWAKAVKEHLAILIDHIENSAYRDRVAGYQLATGWTEEWIAPDRRGANGKRSREKFSGKIAAHIYDPTEEDYYSFLSEMTATRFCEFSRYVKEKTEHRLVVGGFYGYVMELMDRGSGHHALTTVLNSEDVDFLCAPPCYSYAREAGRDHPNMTAIDSLKLHGKLFFAENDTRTHLTKPYCDLPYYQSPVWYGPDKDTAAEILKMHFARALTHGHAFWWFDMWGGWYADDTYMSLLEKMHRITAGALKKELESSAEVAVFVDESVFAEFADDSPITRQTVREIRHTLGFTATPYDIYLATDLAAVRSRYKAFVFLCPTMTAACKNGISALREDALPYLVIDPTNALITPEELRAFFRECGVTPRADGRAVIYENESYLFLHTVNDDAVTLLYDGELREVFGNRITFPAAPGKGKSFLFEKIK